MMNKSISPGISVVIPTYNRQEELLRAINSVETDFPTSVEIIVVNDGGSLQPSKFVPKINKFGVKVRVFSYERNGGPQKARNLGIRRSKYSHIAFLDSDDIFINKKIDIIISEISKNNFDLLFHKVEGMENYSILTDIIFLRKYLKPSLFWVLSIFNPIITPSLVIKRKLILGNPFLRHCEDWSFLLHYVKKETKFTYLPIVLSKVFRAVGTSGGISSAIWKMRRGEFSARLILVKHFNFSNSLRFLIGSICGILRITFDCIRLRYFR